MIMLLLNGMHGLAQAEEENKREDLTVVVFAFASALTFLS